MYAFNYFTTNSDGIVVLPFDFSTHLNFGSLASAGANIRVLTYSSILYTSVDPTLFASATAVISFNSITFAPASSYYNISVSITDVQSTFLAFDLAVGPNCLLTGLKGTILIISNTLQSKFYDFIYDRGSLGFEKQTDNVNSANLEIQDSQWHAYRTQIRFSNQTYYYQPQFFFSVCRFYIIGPFPMLHIEPMLGFDRGQPVVQLNARVAVNVQLKFARYDALIFCRKGNTCLTSPTSTLIDTNLYFYDFFGFEVATSDPASRYTRFHYPFRNFFPSKPKYLGVGLTAVNFDATVNVFSLSINRYGNSGFTIDFTVGGNTLLFWTTFGYIASNTDQVQVFLYDFTTNPRFTNVFGNPTNPGTTLRSLDFVIPFTTTSFITNTVKYSVLFCDFAYTGTVTNFVLHYTHINSTNSYIGIRVHATSAAVFTSMKATIVLASDTAHQAMFNIDKTDHYASQSILSTPNADNSKRTQTDSPVQASRKYLTNPSSIYFVTGISYDTTVPAPSHLSFGIGAYSMTIDSTTHILSVSNFIDIYESTKIYGINYTNWLIDGAATSNNIIMDAVLNGPDATITQYVILSSDFTRNTFILLITETSTNTQTSIPRIVRALQFTGNSFQRTLGVKPLDLSTNANLSYHVVSVKLSTHWCFHAYYFEYLHDFTNIPPDEKACGNFTYDGGTLLKPKYNYSSIIASKIFSTDLTVDARCSVTITFSGVLRSLYVNHEYLLGGSSLDNLTLITLSSTRTVYMYTGEAIYITAIGKYLNISSHSFSCRNALTGNSIAVTFSSYNIIPNRADTYYLTYPQTITCPSNCEICRTSSYCLKCSIGFYQANGTCLTLCPQELSIPTKNQFCDGTQRNMALRNIAPIFNSGVITSSIEIDVYKNFDYIITEYYAYATAYSNIPFVFQGGNFFSLVQSSYDIQQISNIIPSQSINSLASVSVSSNGTNTRVRILTYSGFKDKILFARLMIGSNNLGTFVNYTIENTAFINLWKNSTYKIEYWMNCMDIVCRMTLTFDGFLDIYLNRRNLFFASNFTNITTYELLTNFSGLYHFSMIISKSTLLNFSISGLHDIYAQDVFFNEDSVNVPQSNSCSITNCIDCESNSKCLSCALGFYLTQDFRKCGQFCMERQASDLERRCICSVDKDCFFPNLARCDVTTGICIPCNNDTQCPHIYDGYPGIANCINSRCILCPSDCVKCLNTQICVTCANKFTNYGGVCYINCDPGYKNVSRAQCADICGDGVKPADSSAKTCDDGNIIDGDGCNKNCSVENGYRCVYGGPYTKDSCGLLPKLSVTQDKKTRNIFYLVFTQPMEININLTNVTTLSFISADQSSYTFTIIRSNDFTYILNIENLKTIDRQLMTMTFTDLKNITSKVGVPIEKNLYFLSIEPIPYVSQGNKAAMNSVSNMMGSSSQGTGVSVGAMTASTNPNLVWLFITLMQYFYYLLFINVDYPANAQAFFELFAMGRLDFIANPFVVLSSEVDKTSLPAPKRFVDQNLDGLFIKNSGSMLMIWLGLWGLYGFHYVAFPFSRSFFKPFFSLLQRFKGFFEWSGAIQLWYTYYLDMNISIFLQLRSMSFDSGIYTFSSFLSIVFLFANLALLVFTVSVTYSWKKYSFRRRSEFYALIESYKSREFPARYHNVILLIRKFLTAAILVFCHDYPQIEITILVVINIFPTLITVAKSPYKKFEDRICNGVTESCYFLIHVLIFFVVADNKHTIFDDAERMGFGWMIIFLCLISVGCNFAFMIVILIRLIYRSFFQKQLKAELRKKKQLFKYKYKKGKRKKPTEF